MVTNLLSKKALQLLIMYSMFWERFLLKKCSFRERDSKTSQPKKRFCVKRVSDGVFQSQIILPAWTILLQILGDIATYYIYLDRLFFYCIKSPRRPYKIKATTQNVFALSKFKLTKGFPLCFRHDIEHIIYSEFV